MNGLSTTEELVDRHANLTSRGMGNCRAAQALKKEISRRRLEAQSAFLANDDDHYNPLEHRDHGKWTAGPNVAGSPKNSPPLLKKSDAPKEETYAVQTSTTEALGDLLERAGKAVRDLIYARIFIDIGDWEDAAKQLGITSDQLKKWGWQNVEEDAGTTGGKPSEQGKDMLSPSEQIAVTTAERIVESAPRMGIGEMYPFLGAYAFGATPEGFDYRQAALTMFLPMIGKCSGDITQAIAARTGVSNEIAQQVFNKMGGAAGMASFIGADELDRIRKLPPEQQKQALVDSAGTMGVLFIIGVLSHGESSEPGKTGGDQPNKNAGAGKPTSKQAQESSTDPQDSKRVNAGETPQRIEYRQVFFDAHPDLKGKVFVHHAIEQQVLDLYPGVMTEAEIHSLANLRGIPNDVNNQVHLSDIRKEWNAFYLEHPKSVTKQQLLTKAREIDQKYGRFFKPPIIGANQ